MRYQSLLISLLAVICMAAGEETEQRKSDQSTLKVWQDMVGVWRGVGQPKRGSRVGAWTEQCDWAWKLTDKAASLQVEVRDAKYFRRAELRPLRDKNQFELVAVDASSEATRRYVGAADEQGRLVLLLADEAEVESIPIRISFRQVADGDRMLVLYERKTGDRFIRMAEVGYTRQGSGFGKGTNFVECVVTGGLGTIPVTHDGKTYYVCCTGCRDYFNEDPDTVLAEYRERKAAEKE